MLGWTIIWTLCSTLFPYFFGLIQALILNHKSVKLKKVFQSILILPWAIPQMVSLLVFRNLLNGQFSPVNQLLLRLGLISENKDEALGKLIDDLHNQVLHTEST